MSTRRALPVIAALFVGFLAGLVASRFRPVPPPKEPDAFSVSFPAPAGGREVRVFRVTRHGTSHQSTDVPADAWRVILVRGADVRFYEGAPSVTTDQ